MTSDDTSSNLDVRTRWSEFVQSPAQLGFSRLVKFPPGSERRLADRLDLTDNDRVLEIGSGVGILSGRLLDSGRPSCMLACDVDAEYLRASLPPGLQPASAPSTVRATGFSLPLPDQSVDHVITHTLVNLLPEADWDQLHQEVYRVLSPGGKVTHMDGIGGDSWSPSALELPEAERERRSNFYELLRDTHTRLETGFVNTARDLPVRLRESGFRRVDVKNFSTVLRLNNPEWNEDQRKVLLELWQRADRDRVERLGNLLEATDSMMPERAQLLRQSIADAQQQALRRRKALEENREIGWRSSTTLVVSAERPVLDSR